MEQRVRLNDSFLYTCVFYLVFYLSFTSFANIVVFGKSVLVKLKGRLSSNWNNFVCVN